MPPTVMRAPALYTVQDLAQRLKAPLYGLGAVIPTGVDVLVYTPAEFEAGIRRRFGIFDSIAREGIVVYGRAS
jgi:hypothetical protein